MSTFGHRANPDIHDHQVLDPELTRRGWRKRGGFGLVSGGGTGGVRTP